MSDDDENKQISQKNESSESPVKKKRGRPSKETKLQQKDKENSELKSQITITKVERPKSQSNSPTKLVSKKETPIKVSGKKIKAPLVEEKAEPKKRGRKPKSPAIKQEKAPQKQVPKASTRDEYEFSSDEEEEEENESSDEEFKLESEKENDDEDEEEDQDAESNDDVSIKDDENISEISEPEHKKSPTKKRYNTRRSLKTNKKAADKNEQDETDVSMIDQEEIEDVNLVDKFDKEEKITEWKYELDRETKVFTKPKLPMLSDEAIKPFISSKSNPPKFVIYECPFCQRIFTYPLVFKTHLYSCSNNKNVPEYFLYCSKYEKCSFKSNKKQDMLNHYTKYHSKVSNFINDNNSNSDLDLDGQSDSLDSSDLKVSVSKKNQLKLTSYLFTDKSVFKFTFNYYNDMLSNMYKNLSYLDKFFIDSVQKLDVIELDKLGFDDSILKFEMNKSKFDLKAFEINSNENESFKILNLVDQITAIDWCPVKYDQNDSTKNSQYLAIATLPNQKLLSKFVSDSDRPTMGLLELNKSPNLIYILKLDGLNNNKKTIDFEYNLFSLLNRQIGVISCLKWRPDFGASKSIKKSTNFLGYLLASSSDGNGYVMSVQDMTTNECDKLEDKNNLKTYENNKLCALKVPFSFGQCTSGDWSQLNGATQIALGYANGSIAIFNLNSNLLTNQQKKYESMNEMSIYPIKTINSHFTFVKSLKWSKLKSDFLASGSLFSREIKLWDLNKTDKPILDYEIYITDLEFSLHSNDLFMSKEMNLKGENHMFALDLAFNIFNSEKDESRAHSSLFFTNSSMTSIDQSDYLNKFLVIDNDGSVILSRSDGTKYWIQKNKLMCFSFARIAKLNVKSEIEKDKENSYDVDLLQKSKKNKIIEICLDHVNNKPNSKIASSQLNSINLNLNSLTKIKWNQNVGFHNWYACASLSGFIFLHKINELNVDFNDIV